ncbi:MAG: MFS transporter [Caldilineaceae bacterium]|nr:MFS transporter [Caldilineaceae bacterium]
MSTTNRGSHVAIAGAAAQTRRVQISLYMAAVFLYWMGLYLYVPTLPIYVQSRSDDLAMVGLVLSMYGLWQAIVRLPLGIAADWVGRRKPFILVGFALVGLGAWVMGVAEGVTGLMVGRAITGLAAATWVPLVVVFSGLFPPDEAVRASALLTLVGSVARLLATGSTGALNEWGGYGLAFYLAAGVAVLSLLVVLPAADSVQPPRRPSPGGLVTLVTRRDVLLPSLLSAVGQYVNWAVTFGFLPILARQLGASDVTQSMMTSISVVMVALGNLATTAVVRWLGAQRLSYLSFFMLFVGAGLAALTQSLWVVFVIQVLIGLGQGIGYPVLMGMSIQHVAGHERNTAMGLHQAVYAIGMFAGPWLSGMVAASWGLPAMFGVTAAGALLLGWWGTWWLREGERSGY